MLRIEAVVYRNAAQQTAISITATEDPTTILVQVSFYEVVKGVTVVTTYDDGGLIQFGSDAFNMQMMNVASRYFGQKSETDGTPACNAAEFCVLLNAILEFKR